MQQKKGLIVLWMMILSIILVAGCSNGNQEKANADKEETNAETKEDVTLRFSWWGGDVRHEATLAAIEAYKKVAPNVTIEAEYQGFDGYEQKVKTQLASSTSADIMQLDAPWMQELTKSDFFLDLSKQPGLTLDGFDKGFLDDFSVYKGKTAALPTGLNAYILVINKSAADKLGVPTNIKWDWDALYEAGKTLHKKDPSKYLLVADHNGLMQDFTSILKQRTGDQWVKEDYTLGFTKEDAVSGFSWLKKAMEAGVYQPLGESDLYFGKIDQNPKWISQDIIMTPAMTSTLAPLKSVLPKEVEIATALPAIDKNAKDSAVVIRPSQLIAISSKTKHPEEAVKFLNWFMNDPEAAAILGDVRSTPVSASAQKAAVEAGKIDETITKAVELDLANAGIVDSPVATNSQVLATLQDVVEKVAFDKLQPEEAADELITSLEKKLKELQGRQ